VNISRVIRTFSAHSYGQIITIFSTLVGPTVAVANWGAEGFGYWVSLSALAQFFSLSDLGASIALANQLCLKSDRSIDEAYRLTRNVILSYIKNAAISLAIILAAAFFLAFYYSYLISSQDAFILAFTFAAIAFSAALQPAIGIYSAAWRFIGRNEVGIFISNTIRLLEFLIFIGIVLLGKQMLIAAIVGALLKILASLIMYFHIPSLIKQGKDKQLLSQKAQMHIELNKLTKAGHGFTLISLSQQLTLQGPVLLISVILGPVQAAVFAACRTLSRLPVQPLSILLASLNPELTELIANKNYKQLKIIVFRMLFGVIILSILTGISSVYFIDIIQKYWLENKLNLDIKVLIPLCLAATFYLCGQVLNQTLTAANKTRAQSKQFIVVGFLMIILMTPLLLLTEQTMWSAIIVLIAESLMAVLLVHRYFVSLAHMKN
jgi:O-antigen/teichoic acid export membrane protein